MGAGSYNPSASAARAAYRQSTGVTAFQHNAAAAAGRAPKLHPTLDPKAKPIRECFDNPDSPESTPIAIFVDETGSMSQIPELVLNDLNKMMATLAQKDAIKYPQVMFGAIGDAHESWGRLEEAPLQIGEFEASDELTEQHLSNIFLEHGGGGQGMESYDLALHFMNKHVQTDAWNKRGEKGFLFIIGDEGPYPYVEKDIVERIIGTEIEDNIPISTVAANVQEKWHTFIVRPGGTSCFHDDGIHSSWEKIVPPERVIRVEDWKEIVPTIAATIAIINGVGADDMVDALAASGLSVSSDTSTALARLESTSSIVNAGADLVSAGGATTERL